MSYALTPLTLNMEYDDIDINATLQSNYVPFELLEDNDCVEVNADKLESQDTVT
ncbi:hypothetical protein CRYUN_Cryun09bG0095200 [Craigia yunnanensis]